MTDTGSDAELDDLLGVRNGIYACTRAWEAWSIGTMTEDDFIPAAEADVRADLIAWRDAAVAAERERHHVSPLRTDALIRDLAILLRGSLHPSVEIGPPARLVSRRLRDVLGIKDGDMARDVEARLRSALASGAGQ
jgi:hypothetical protein